VRRGVAAALLVPLLAGCGSTTYDATLATSAIPTSSTTTTLPVGSAADILPEMLTQAQSLSTVILARGDDGAVLAEIDDDWQVVRPEIESARPELIPDFEGVLRVLGTASKFNRAADADKAAKNLKALVATFLAGGVAGA
jgi:hypothetical protein